MAQAKSRLGRGLSGLISGSRGAGKAKAAEDGGPPEAGETPAKARADAGAGADAEKSASAATADGLNGYREVAVGKIDPNPYQPRREFSEEHLGELAESIRSEGLLQPIVVRPRDGRYQLIAGERRWRAVQMLKLKKIPARVVEASDASSATISLIENLQREGLNPIEEAMGYASLIRDFDLTQERVAERVGKNRATVANALRLMNLGTQIQGFLAKGLLSTGHAKALLSLENPEEQALLATQIIEGGLSVREAERLARRSKEKRSAPSGGKTVEDSARHSAIRDLEQRLASRLNTRVSMKHSQKKGRILIEYYGNEDLQRILEKMGVAE